MMCPLGFPEKYSFFYNVVDDPIVRTERSSFFTVPETPLPWHKGSSSISFHIQLPAKHCKFVYLHKDGNKRRRHLKSRKESTN